MKKKEKINKLKISRETLRLLVDPDLRNANGACSGCCEPDYPSATDCGYCATFTC